MSERIDELLAKIHRGLGVNEFCELEAAVNRLRAELAAEKEKVLMWKGLQRGTALIVKQLEDAAAIRASNVAPPQPCSYPQYCGREVCNCPRDTAPPKGDDK